ncbi:MAG: hypothetical protein K2X81_09480 [Candidatus Obscuribacterales bacterium]|nr:hypothetical protein [Candidatus Obscuribacterales bacterium]
MNSLNNNESKAQMKTQRKLKRALKAIAIAKSLGHAIANEELIEEVEYLPEPTDPRAARLFVQVYLSAVKILDSRDDLERKEQLLKRAVATCQQFNLEHLWLRSTGLLVEQQACGGLYTKP